MKRTLSFLWEVYGFSVLKVELAFMAVIFFFNRVFFLSDLVGTYVAVYPILHVLFLFIFGYSLTTLYRAQALGFPCRRKDFFWGSQLMFLLTVLMAVACTVILGAALERFGNLSLLAERFRFIADYGIYWAKPAMLKWLAYICLCVLPISAATGCLYQKNKVIGMIVYIVAMLFAIGGVVLLLFAADGVSMRVPAWVIPTLGIVLGVSAVVSEVYFALENRRAIVR